MERKGGVQVLDVADVIIESFRKAGVNLATQEFVSLEEVLEEGERYEDVVASQGKDYAERMRLKKEREEKEKKKTVKEEDESSEEEEVVQEKKLSPEQSKEMDTDKDGDIDGEDLENLRDKKKKKGAAKKDEDDEKEDKSEKGDDAAMTAESKEEEGEEELDLGAEVRSGKDITQELADILDSLDLDSLTSDNDE
jgi:hypothetical protein